MVNKEQIFQKIYTISKNTKTYKGAMNKICKLFTENNILFHIFKIPKNTDSYFKLKSSIYFIINNRVYSSIISDRWGEWGCSFYQIKYIDLEKAYNRSYTCFIKNNLLVKYIIVQMMVHESLLN